jgi:hypothetical protein
VRTLKVLLAVAVAVSVVHYTDNVFNYSAYPDPTSGPDPSRAVIGAAWFVFTAFAVAGYRLYRDGRRSAAALCLAAYSGSGLVGLGHYAVPGATGMPWWRQAHIVADILCGIAILAFAFATVRTEGRRPAAPNPTP